MLEFERSRDTAGHVEQINKEVSALEDALQKCQKNEKKYRKVCGEISFQDKNRTISFRLSKIFNMKLVKLKIVY